MNFHRMLGPVQCALAASLICASAARAARVPRIELSEQFRVAAASRTELSESVAATRNFTLREARLIELAEVYEAIRKSLIKVGAGEAPPLRPEDVTLQTEVLVHPGDVGLEVLNAELDAGLGRARFLLWASNDPKVLPFIVTARWNGALPPGLARRELAENRDAGVADLARKPVDRARREILVSGGEPATLVLHSGGLRLTVDVRALERGTLGQRIRVRLVDTGKMFIARVDGRAHLDSNF